MIWYLLAVFKKITYNGVQKQPNQKRREYVFHHFYVRILAQYCNQWVSYFERLWGKWFYFSFTERIQYYSTGCLIQISLFHIRNGYELVMLFGVFCWCQMFINYWGTGWFVKIVNFGNKWIIKLLPVTLYLLVIFFILFIWCFVINFAHFVF